MKYLVQAILIDNIGKTTPIETVVDSIKTDNLDETLEFVMKRHKHCPHYIYVAMKIETQQIVLKTGYNLFA